jgi:copper resistance protein B
MGRGLILPVLALLAATPARAMEEDGTFHRVDVELDGTRTAGASLFTWEGAAWIGGDRDKAWFRTEGEIRGGETEQAEIWALLSRAIGYSGNIADSFWDAQFGLRQDFEPEPTSQAVIGIEGMAPYFIETGAHVFLSDEGDVSARITQSLDLPLTQRLIAEPHIELNLSAQDNEARQTGAGLSDIEAGLQLRYEITRKFAPYAGINYERAIGETAGLRRAEGEQAGDLTLRLGVRFWF